jgi:two-component system response regulator DegU
MQSSIRLIVADDHHLFRKSLCSLLKSYPDLQIVADAADGRSLLDLLKTVKADIVLLDLQMPGVNGVQVLEVIQQRYPDIKVIVLSVMLDPVTINQVMRRGAKAAIAKDCEVEALLQAIREVKTTGYFLDETVSRAMLENMLKQAHRIRKLQLSERELQVLELLCAGKINKEIAIVLNITARTVDFHRGNLYAKSATTNLAQLVMYAVKNKLVQPSEGLPVG